MKTKLIGESQYNGFGHTVTNWPKEKHVDVEILGVMVPPDPGMVTISDGKKQFEVPTMVLKECPKIDWKALMSEMQKLEVDSLGVLFGAGFSTKERSLKPIAECPTIP